MDNGVSGTDTLGVTRRKSCRGGWPVAERVIACGTVLLIVVIGIVRGFSGLDRLDRVTLAAVLVLTTVLGATLLLHDGRALLGESGLTLPPLTDLGILQTLLVLGGIVITVQGFETVAYPGDENNAETRVWASLLRSTSNSLRWRPR